jgi:hypothetical protein
VLVLPVLAALASPAFAGDDPDDDPEDESYAAFPGHAVAIGLHGHGSRVDGQTEGGVGPVIELALGRQRWQYVVEAGISTSSRNQVDGNQMRAALGARWLARQFAPNRYVGLELLLGADAGVQRLAYHDGARTVRPEVALGMAIQGRLYHRPHVTLRVDLRAVFTPDRDDRMNEAGASMGLQTGLTCGF